MQTEYPSLYFYLDKDDSGNEEVYLELTEEDSKHSYILRVFTTPELASKIRNKGKSL
jgi:hypothetical protein